jgi:hypothetical protein
MPNARQILLGALKIPSRSVSAWLIRYVPDAHRHARIQDAGPTRDLIGSLAAQIHL